MTVAWRRIGRATVVVGGGRRQAGPAAAAVVATIVAPCRPDSLQPKGFIHQKLWLREAYSRALEVLGHHAQPRRAGVHALVGGTPVDSTTCHKVETAHIAARHRERRRHPVLAVWTGAGGSRGHGGLERRPPSSSGAAQWGCQWLSMRPAVAAGAWAPLSVKNSGGLVSRQARGPCQGVREAARLDKNLVRQD